MSDARLKTKGKEQMSLPDIPKNTSLLPTDWL
jgi:hypothetical protein